MVSRLFGKLEAQRQRICGRAGACATAWVTAAALATPTAPRARNLRRFIGRSSSGKGPPFYDESPKCRTAIDRVAAGSGAFARAGVRLALRAVRWLVRRVDEPRDVRGLHGLREMVVEARFLRAAPILLLPPARHRDDEHVCAARLAAAPCRLVPRERL